MPDFRYRQTTATLDVGQHAFRAAGRQPVELGWRAAFPDWQPAEEKGDEAQLLPSLRDGEPAVLRDAKVEGKETKPPPRYNEGTLVEAMQNAWRFVEDEALRERLKEAKGIGTPATRAEIIRGLKTQEFLTTQGKHIVPTERGLSLFGVLEQADPALVDPGATAQLERLLDEVLVGRQEMMGAIDAVCAVASRIIGRLTAGAATGAAPLLAAGVKNEGGARPPTPAMKRFVDRLARQKGIKPPRGYTKSGSVCRTFLDQHAPRKADKGAGVEIGSTPPNTAQVLLAERIAQEQGDVLPGEARTGAVALSASTEAHQGTEPVTRGRKTGRRKQKSSVRKTPGKRSGSSAEPSPRSQTSGTDIPLRIPFGNKEAALQLGARYRSGGWYAPPGVDLGAFRERGWL